MQMYRGKGLGRTTEGRAQQKYRVSWRRRNPYLSRESIAFCSPYH
jgi:hypothetical protein